MRRFRAPLMLLIVIFVSGTQAQTPTTPTPDPELKKLAVWVGHWTFQADYKAGPLGPAAKTTGETLVRPILRGFFYEVQATEKGPTRETHSLTLYGYDPVNKNFPFTSFSDDGSTASGALSASGNTFSAEIKFAVGGKEYRSRDHWVMTTDGMSASSKGEISTDSKTWIPFFETKVTKTESAVK